MAEARAGGHTAGDPGYTDQWQGYPRLKPAYRPLSQGHQEGVRADEGEGGQEGQGNPSAGLGTPARNFLRPLRGGPQQTDCRAVRLGLLPQPL